MPTNHHHPLQHPCPRLRTSLCHRTPRCCRPCRSWTAASSGTSPDAACPHSVHLMSVAVVAVAVVPRVVRGLLPRLTSKACARSLQKHVAAPTTVAPTTADWRLHSDGRVAGVASQSAGSGVVQALMPTRRSQQHCRSHHLSCAKAAQETPTTQVRLKTMSQHQHQHQHQQHQKRTQGCRVHSLVT